MILSCFFDKYFTFNASDEINIDLHTLYSKICSLSEARKNLCQVKYPWSVYMILYFLISVLMNEYNIIEKLFTVDLSNFLCHVGGTAFSRFA